jgi:DNA-binding response OmpR family regulator
LFFLACLSQAKEYGMIVLSVAQNGILIDKIKEKLKVDVMSLDDVSMVPEVIKSFTRPVWVVDINRPNALVAIEKAANAAIIAIGDNRITAPTAVLLIGKAVELLREPTVEQIVDAVMRHTTQFSAYEFVIDTYQRRAWYRGKEFELSSTRFDILAHLIRMAGRQTTYQAIALDVYNERLSDQEALARLKSHVHYLRQDLKEVVGSDLLKSQRGSVFWLSR